MQSELRADEVLVALRHVLKTQLSDFVAVHVFQHGLRRDEDAWTGLDVAGLFQLLLQGNELVPVGHGGLFAPAYEGVNGSSAERCCTVAFHIHNDGNVGNGKVLLELVLTVQIDQLQQDVRC